ncbi:histone H1-like [Pristis pectinata]|uniref:histone H1-like n=1 Tax=Pristis pectinata TaxID=685728 RepID=UPI00223D1F38|nr:histone H1-like [Pristis pectinata]
MTETAAAEAAPPAANAAQTKAPKKKKAAARNKAAGPTLGEQIDQIVAGCPNKRGMSAIAIKKALATRGVDIAKRGAQIRFSIKRKAPKEKSSLKLVNKAKKAAAKKVVKNKPAIKKKASNKSVARKVGAKQSPTKKQGPRKPAAKTAAEKKPEAKKTPL